MGDNLKYKFSVPEQKRVRMIVHADAKNEADDQYAIVHHLLTPKFDVQGIIAGHFEINPKQYGSGNTATASYKEIEKVLNLMGPEYAKPIYMGSELPLVDELTPRESEGVQFIIDQAHSDDPRPLFIAMQGAITDLASAILIDPSICSKMTCIWIGGGEYPNGGDEFNCSNDIAAANVVFSSDMEVWQIPKNVYKDVAVSLAELQLFVSPHGEIGKYLFEQLIAYNHECADIPHWPNGESWTLGDNPTIGVLLDEVERTDLYEYISAPRISYSDMSYSFEESNRKIRVYSKINSRLIIGDLFAKIALNFG